MDVALYTGNGSTQTISGLNFSPDLVWNKVRNDSYWHSITDTVRGATKTLYPNDTLAEFTDAASVQAFTSDGFTLGSQALVNESAKTYVAWTWDAGTSTVTNTEGSITSQVRANASAGFSVVTYTGTGSNATVGHGLGVAPQMVIVKQRLTPTENWLVYHASLTSPSNSFLVLNTTAARGEVAGYWNGGPTSSVVGLSFRGAINTNNNNYVAYCFAPVAGYSSFGSYTGNGSADGPFVYTGMRPRWIMFKRTDTTADWLLLDTARDNYNAVEKHLHPNLSNAEATGSPPWADILSNGFKLRNTYGETNASGGTYIYACFAESPFQYARAR
jgi:hypothetical protein